MHCLYTDRHKGCSQGSPHTCIPLATNLDAAARHTPLPKVLNRCAGHAAAPGRPEHAPCDLAAPVSPAQPTPLRWRQTLYLLCCSLGQTWQPTTSLYTPATLLGQAPPAQPTLLCTGPKGTQGPTRWTLARLALPAAVWRPVSWRLPALGPWSASGLGMMTEVRAGLLCSCKRRHQQRVAQGVHCSNSSQECSHQRVPAAGCARPVWARQA